MATNLKFAQLQPFALYGAGASTGDTSITLQSMTDIDGNALSMSGTFGTKGYGTLEPGNGTLEEQISFTGLANNANGTVTLSGVKSVGFTYPYTETSGLAKTHAGNAVFIITNTARFYDQFVSKDNDGTVSELITFSTYPQIAAPNTPPTQNAEFATKKYVDDTATSGAPDAGTSTKGIVQLPTQAQVDARTATGSTGAALTPTPANLRTVQMHDSATSAVGTDAYAITLTPAVTAYADGDIYIFKADVANTGACTLAVNGLSAISIKLAGLTPRDNYIKAGQTVMVRYNSTGPVMNILSVSGQPQISQDGGEIYGASSAGTDTYAITVPYLAAYTAGQVFRFTADVGNTGAASLNVNSIGALTIKTAAGAGLSTGNILAGQIVEVAVIDGSNCMMLSPTASLALGLFASGTTSKNSADASAAQTIAHGLGVIPKYVRLHAIAQATGTIGSALIVAQAISVYNGTTQSSMSSKLASGPAYSATTSFDLNATANDSGTQTGVITFDATNITITWTKTASPVGTYNILWEAFA